MASIIKDLAPSLPPASGAGASGIPGITKKLNQELARWQGKKESENLGVLEEYWSNIGWSSDDWSPTGTPWSAAFVSFVVPSLRPSSAHWQYVQSVIDGKSTGWTAYKIDDNTKLNPGDVIVKPRGSGGLKGTSDYYASHGDVVHSLNKTTGRVNLVGGNVGDTAKLVGTVEQLGNQYPYLIVLKKKSSYLKWILGALGAGFLIKKFLLK